MKATITKETLLSALNAVRYAAANSPSEPDGRIVVSAEDDALTITAQLTRDASGLGIRCKVPARVEEPGAVWTSHRHARDIVRHSPDADVTLAAQMPENPDAPGKLIISAGRSRSSVTSYNAANAPVGLGFLPDEGEKSTGPPPASTPCRTPAPTPPAKAGI